MSPQLHQRGLGIIEIELQPPSPVVAPPFNQVELALRPAALEIELRLHPPRARIWIAPGVESDILRLLPACLLPQPDEHLVRVELQFLDPGINRGLNVNFCQQPRSLLPRGVLRIASQTRRFGGIPALKVFMNKHLLLGG